MIAVTSRAVAAASLDPAHHAAPEALSPSMLVAVHGAAARELQHISRSGTGRLDLLRAKPAAGLATRSAPLMISVLQSNRCAVLQDP